MQIDLRPEGQWEDLNEEAGHRLGLGKNATAHIYRGVGHALLEATAGLLRMFPHKRKVFYMKNLDPWVYLPMAQLATEGLDVQAVEQEIFDNPDSLDELLDSETLFFLYSEDAPLTGAKYPVDKISQAIGDKRVFRICVSHFAHNHQVNLESLHRYDAKVMSLAGGTMSLALLGERARFQAPIARSLVWEFESTLKELDGLGQVSEQKEKIEKFEASGAGGMTPFFKPGAGRVYDRAVVYWKDMDGHAFIDELAKELKLELPKAGSPSLLETASLSRWGGVKTMDWLGAQGIDVDIIRGLVVIDQSLIDDDLPEKVETTRNRILDWQG